MPRHDDSDPESNYRSARQRSHTPGPRRRDRDLSPPYPPSSAPDHPPHASGAIPPERHPRFSDPAPVYDGHTPFYPPETNPDFRGDRGDRDIPRDTQTNHNTSLQPAPHSSRPRSSRLNSDSSLTTTNTPSTVSSYSHHPSSRSRDRDRVLARPRSRRSSSSSSTSSFDKKDGVPYQRGPIHKTKKALENTFTPSTSGLGVGVLGAIVGGLAASEIEHRAHKKHGHKGGSGDRHRHGDDKTKNLISTIVGAAVGGLSANALEKQMEKRRGEEGERRGEVKEKERELRGLERRVKEGEWERDRYRNGDRRY